MASNIIVSAQDCIKYVASQTDECLLFLSTGKDSLVTLDLIYPHFKHVTCVFMYFVQGLEHIERWMRWAKTRYPGIDIIQVPHFTLSYALRSGLCCVPNPKVKLMSLSSVVKAVRNQTGLYHTFLGMKKADGMNRRLMLNTYREQHYTNMGMCYPLAEWTQKDILAYMRQNRLPQPVRYNIKMASSGVGFNYDCLAWLRDNFPQDLQKFFTVFPLAERILWQHDHQGEQNEQPLC